MKNILLILICTYSAFGQVFFVKNLGTEKIEVGIYEGFTTPRFQQINNGEYKFENYVNNHFWISDLKGEFFMPVKDGDTIFLSTNGEIKHSIIKNEDLNQRLSLEDLLNGVKPIVKNSPYEKILMAHIVSKSISDGLNAKTLSNKQIESILNNYNFLLKSDAFALSNGYASLLKSKNNEVTFKDILALSNIEAIKILGINHISSEAKNQNQAPNINEIKKIDIRTKSSLTSNYFRKNKAFFKIETQRLDEYLDPLISSEGQIKYLSEIITDQIQVVYFLKKNEDKLPIVTQNSLFLVNKGFSIPTMKSNHFFTLDNPKEGFSGFVAKNRSMKVVLKNGVIISKNVI